MTGKNSFFQAVVLSFYIALALFQPLHASPSVRYAKTNVNGVPARVVVVDLANPANIPKVQLSAGFPMMADSFSSFVRRSKPAVAVTGTYFCMRTLKPVGDIVINGKQINFGGMGTAMCVTKTNNIVFTDVDWGHHADYSHCQTVLASGPRLLLNGALWLYPKQQGFTDRGILGKSTRIGIGLTAKNKLVIIVVEMLISLEKMGKMMKQLGCVDAMGLDAGGSMALYVNGKMMLNPTRKLVNVLVIPGEKTVSASAFRVALNDTADSVLSSLLLAENAPANATDEEQMSQEAYLLGQKLETQRRIEAALEAYSDAVYFAPDNAVFSLALAALYLKMKAPADASAAFTLAAKAYAGKKAFVDAVTTFQKALELSPKNIEAHRGLASAYSALGRSAEAQQELKIIEDLSVESASIASVTETVRMLQEEDPEFLRVHGRRPVQLSGSYENGAYTESKLKFSFVLPEGWAYEEIPDNFAMKMRDMDNPYFASLQSVPLTKDISLEAFEERFMDGMFKKKVAERTRMFSGEDAYEVLYEEFINDRAWGSRYIYAKYKNVMYILSMTTYAERYEDASSAFAPLVNSFSFLP